METVCYEELTPRAFRKRLTAAPIAYVPLGTLEWHGEHLPLGSDGLQSRGFFIELAREVGGVVLPMLFLGPDFRQEYEGHPYYGMDVYSFSDGIPRRLEGSAYWVEQAFYEAMLDRIVAQLVRAGFRILVGHGHAPSVQAWLGRKIEWEAHYGVKVFACWREDESDGLGIQTDHAAANETSLVMALRPDLVEMNGLDPDPAVQPLGIGGDDPRIHASPEKGRKAIDMQRARMAAMLRDVLRQVRV
ncbi:MAG TPA: creatininase family protein [Candidatus Hydrogenedentes bacterium]|nr:creatininase family protein [Candidatus Hydrogenedentota bacterium]HRT20240.1 creatininase family protein [Candidatus Hydrogenedentota bacterium]HRT64302.1 creatininase family protein [Candidatus Hydrogenedentota bacterium]